MRKLPLPPLAFLPWLILLVLPGIPASARDLSVPETLKPWMGWVAAGHPELACPEEAAGGPVCVAYASLKLDLGDQGGGFVQLVTVFGSQWVRLPGGTQAWPKDVRDGNAAAPVLLKDGLPQVRLSQGEHTLTGGFAWEECPAALPVPPGTALLGLRLKGKDMPSPEFDAGSDLQLGGSGRARRDTGAEEAPLTLRVFRKLSDGIPMRMETFLAVSASGRDREILTGRLLPEGSAILSIRSDLPMRVEPDGRLRVQLRSGEHTLLVASRFLYPVASMAMEKRDSLWPDAEIWSFEAQRDLRVVELAGAPLIDPSQTGLPEAWKGLPAYRMIPGDTLRIAEKQRGNPSPQSGNLSLRRTLWLDFPGRGFTVRDEVSGNLAMRTRLEMEGGFRMGRAEVDGNPVMITSLRDRAGVEIPAGPLNLMALGRFQRGGAPLPAAGWNQSFAGAHATLNLPPGWKLIHAGGPDTVVNSWVTEWSLWEVFMLCILTVAVLRLAGWKAGALALICFTLISQEEGWPGLLWLNLLAALGLWRVLPPGRLRTIANLYRYASLALMAAIWIPFAVAHARKALYPQLDGPASSAFRNANASLVSSGGYSRLTMKSVAAEAAPEQARMMAPPASPEAEEKEDKAEDGAAGGYRGSLSKQDYAPRPRRPFVPEAARVQSGPGEPQWNLDTAELTWSGPVQAGERLNLTLSRPWLTRCLRALQAILPGALLLLLAFPMAGTRLRKGNSGKPGNAASGFGLPPIVLLLMLSAGGAAEAAGADFPPDSLLKELETRMAAPRSCAPACAALNSARITVAGNEVRIALIFDVADTSLALLPQAGEGQWSLSALRVGNKAAAGAVKLPGGRIAVALPRGRHTVLMEGRLPGPRLELNFGSEARNLSVQAPGYAVQGLLRGTSEGGTVILQRRESAASERKGPELTPDPIAPYVEVMRTLVLDREWTLETRVLRRAPASGAFSAEIPLMPFEHPTTAGMAEAKGMAVVSLQEGQAETGWHSVVDRGGALKFIAGPLAERSETWSVAASSRWHLEASGPPPVLPTEAGGAPAAEPRWKPMPGDTLVLTITEPEAASGPVKTIESAELTLTPGKRESRAALRLRVRAGQGDVTRVVLPAGARLESLAIDGAVQTLTQREGKLALPLHPGVQALALEWKQPDGIRLWQRTPAVILEDEAANISLIMNMPGDRWTLWVGGGAIGPALLLWGVLAVLFAIAFLLGRSRLTPLSSLDWALLFLGTSMVNLYATAPLLAMFLALRRREKLAPAWSDRKHNLFQILCAGLGLIGFGMLLAAVPEGLLSAPDMQITGNDSSNDWLRWFQDRSQGALPAGWALSLPMWIYRLAMLTWSLWLALRLLRWLKWSWDRFSTGGFWRQIPRRKPPVPGKQP